MAALRWAERGTTNENGFYILSSSPSPNFPSVKYAHNIKYIFITESVGRREGGREAGGVVSSFFVSVFFLRFRFFSILSVSLTILSLYIERHSFLSLSIDRSPHDFLV